MKVLLISYFFAPQNTIAAVRTTKIAKYLIRLGYDVEVVCGPPTFIDPILKSDLKEIKKLNVVHGLKMYEKKSKEFINNNNVYKNSILKKILRKIKSILYKVLPNPPPVYLAFLNSLIWVYNARKILTNKIFYYDIIISSYGPIGSHILGLYLKLRHKKIFWIADYRDPMIDDKQKSTIRFIYSIYQYLSLKYADISLCVSKGLKEELASLQANAKLYIITNGYDNEDMSFLNQEQLNKNKLIFSYAGSMYAGKRDLSPLFSILNELAIEKKIDIKLIKILYMGNEFSTIKEMAKPYELDEILVDLGFVSRDKALNILNNSDVLLLASWNTKKSQGILTGKIYEMILLKKPILAFINGYAKNSELKEIIVKLNGGFVYEEGDKDSYNSIKDKIASLYKQKFESFFISQEYNMEFRAKYDYKNIVKTLNNIIHDNKK